MALPVLDGNQSATTLSSVVTGGEHIVAHSVVSLGTTAISNIATAVSGVSISISGTPSTTFGAVTGSVSILGTPTVTIPGLAHLGNSVATDGVADATTNFIKIGGHQSGQNQTSHIVHVSAGGSMSVDASGSSVTFSQASVTFGAITGSASILNFPSTQTIAGTVTVGASSVTFNAYIGQRGDGSWQPISLQSGSNYVNANVQNSVTISSLPTISGTVTVGNSVTISSLPALPAGNNQIGKVQILPDLSNPIYSVVTNGSAVRIYDSGGQDIVVDGGLQAIQATLVTSVTVGNSVTIGSLPAISGTVTVSNATTASAVAVRLIAEDTNPGGSGAGVNVNLYSNDNALLVDALKNGNSVLGYDGLSSYVQVKPAIGSSVTIGSLPAISGTVTANLPTSGAFGGSLQGYNGTNTYLNVGLEAVGGNTLRSGGTLPISGTVTVGNSVTIGSLPTISGTVTANNPNGALTTRFGSVTTANTAQITSAVTNTSRKYLLAQNISAGTVTIGIGFSPTTTQGIQLNAGAGLTFDSFCPTGAVYWLGAVTGAAFTILEG